MGGSVGQSDRKYTDHLPAPPPAQTHTHTQSLPCTWSPRSSKCFLSSTSASVGSSACRRVTTVLRGESQRRRRLTSRMMCWIKWTESKEVFFREVTSECRALSFLRISLRVGGWVGVEGEEEEKAVRMRCCMHILGGLEWVGGVTYLRMGKSSSTIESTRAYTKKRGPFRRILEPAYLYGRWVDE